MTISDFYYKIKIMNEKLKKYVENTARIRELSSPKISDIKSAAQYSIAVKDNFIKIGKLSMENRDILSEQLFPYLNEEKPIDVDDAESLGEFCDSLLDAYSLDNLDPAIHDLLSKRLLTLAEDHRDMREKVLGIDREITSCYTMMNITDRLSSFPEIAAAYRKRGLEAAEKVKKLLDPEFFKKLPDNECREMVLINARYMCSLYEGTRLSVEESRENYDMLVRALEIARDADYISDMEDYDWRRHEFRTLNYISMLLDYHNRRGIPEDVVEKIAERVAQMDRMWHTDRDYFSELMRENELSFHVLRARYESGVISRDIYHKNLIALYDMRDPNDYDLSGMCINLMLPTEYILTLDMSHLSERDRHNLNWFYANALHYAFNMSGTESLSFMLEFLSMLMTNFVEIPGGMSFEDFCLSCMAALHPPTYVHSTMVAQISRCMTRHLLRLDRSLFKDLFEMLSTDDDEVVLSFVFHAARSHDFGKIFITDTIMVYGRKLLDSEFDLIKKHPDAGADIMQKHRSTAMYANVARSHHIWYDGSRGYPEGFDTSKLPEKVVVDIVECADCLDAATDIVGRSYSRGKTIFEFARELSEGAGTRYAPYLPQLFSDKDFLADMSYLLSNVRRKNYERVYERLVSVEEESMLYSEAG